MRKIGYWLEFPPAHRAFLALTSLCLFAPFPPHSPLLTASPLLCVLVLEAAAAAAVSPEVKQSAVIYQRVISPI